MREPHHRRRIERPTGGPAPKVRPQRSGLPRVELVLIGRELLRGTIADANGPALARWFASQSASVDRITVVGDDEASITGAVGDALSRNPHLVVTTGGLGPAMDDRTLAAVAGALQLPLKIDPRARQMVEVAYQRLRTRKVLYKGGLNLSREKMCELPVGGEAVENPVGIAPGVICRLAGGAILLCLPGLPREMQAVLEAAGEQIRITPAGVRLALREIESPTADESSLQPLLDKLADEFPDVWVHSHHAGSRNSGSKVMISLEAIGSNQREADIAVDGVVKRLLALASGSP